MRDASGHEHASDGRFGRTAGQHGGKEESSKRSEPKKKPRTASQGARGQSKPSSDPRHNPDLDPAWNSESPKPKPAASGNIRHNPALDELMDIEGWNSPQKPDPAKMATEAAAKIGQQFAFGKAHKVKDFIAALRGVDPATLQAIAQTAGFQKTDKPRDVVQKFYAAFGGKVKVSFPGTPPPLPKRGKLIGHDPKEDQQLRDAVAAKKGGKQPPPLPGQAPKPTSDKMQQTQDKRKSASDHWNSLDQSAKHELAKKWIEATGGRKDLHRWLADYLHPKPRKRRKGWHPWLIKRTQWDESKHPRGQAENAGEFASGGGSGSKKKTEVAKPVAGESKMAVQAKAIVKKIKPVKQRAFTGEPTGGKISKQLAGAIGEEIIIQYLQSQGFKDAGQLSGFVGTEKNNLPVDLIHDHRVIEVKTGQSSNSDAAQQWRLTIGEPGEKEKAWLKTASGEEKAAFNAKKQAMIHKRKKEEIAKLGKELGYTVKGNTMTVIINPDTKTADLYKFEGFHDRIGWKSETATNGYIGSVKYG